MNKRYFWLKLKEDFFQDDAIEWLEEQKNGKEYCLFYLKLCLKALKDDGRLIRKVGNILVPYTPEKLAEITRMKVDTAIMAINLLQRIGLVKYLETEKTYFIPQLQNMVGSETQGAERVRKHRKEQKEKLLQCNNDVTPILEQSCNNDTKTVTPMLEQSCNNDAKKVTTEYRDKSIEYRDKSTSSSGSSNIYVSLGDNVTDTTTAAAKEAIVFWFKNTGRDNDVIRGDIADLVEQYGQDMAMTALREAIRANVLKVKYAKAVAERMASGEDTRAAKAEQLPF